MTIETWFNITVVVFTVSNLMAGGLECDLKVALKWLRSPKLLAPIFVWGWVVGPALGLADHPDPSAGGGTCRRPGVAAAWRPSRRSSSWSSTKARGDMTFAGAYVLLGTVGTVVLMPLMAPLLIKGLTISTWPLAKPLLLTMLMPLIIGAAIRAYAAKAATTIFPAVKKTGRYLPPCSAWGRAWCIYGQEMLNTAGQLCPFP